MREYLQRTKMADFFIKTHQATERGVLPWQETEQEHVLLVPLDRNYRIKLVRVPDLDGEGVGYDIVVHLLQGAAVILSLDRRDLELADLEPIYGANPRKDLRQVFHGVWEAASAKALRLGEHLREVENILSGRLRA